ncbi:hypothetical protein AB4Z29_06805 [Paenibacillus sp. 2TAB23]|uniref:hypothetical protein n=1 Tax=Paenibacillus sp. 2TAB23 TaxID=3233004 RepID=UPI003F97F763
MADRSCAALTGKQTAQGVLPELFFVAKPVDPIKIMIQYVNPYAITVIEASGITHERTKEAANAATAIRLRAG